MKKVLYLSLHTTSITGGHKYNDAFVAYLEKVSGIKIQSTPPCSSIYTGIKRLLSPIIELKHLMHFGNDTLVLFADTAYKYHFILALINKWVFHSQTAMIVHHFPFIGGTGLIWRINKWLMCRYTSLMDTIIIPSPFTMDVAKSLFPYKRLCYIPLFFEQKFKKSNNFEANSLLYVGTIEERKGLTYLIDAISYLKGKDSIKLNLVGKIVDMSYYERLQQQINLLGLSNNVCFLGRVSDEILADYYQKAEIFTFPSLLEGYGIVLIEAFNNALPIICFDNSAMPYTVKHNINGLLAKHKDAKDLSDKIELLLGNKALREELQKGIEDTVMRLTTKDDFEKGIRDFWSSISCMS